MQNRLGRIIHPFVSVIVPVFNDVKSLQVCLAALESQTYPSSLYEIIVVDNDSDETIEDVASQFSRVLTTYESYPGSYAARNKGISLAQGDVLAFTDADCIPALDWIEKGVVYLLSVSNCGLIAGKIELFFQNPNQPTAVELYDSMSSFRQEEYIEKYKAGATANLWTFKKVIDDVGDFDPTFKSGGDMEWGERVFAAGYQLVYADKVQVAHPARRSLDQLYKKTVRRAGGEHDRKKKEGCSAIKLLTELARELRPPLKASARVLWDKELGRISQKGQVILLMFLTRYSKAFEKIRLLLGGTPQRS